MLWNAVNHVLYVSLTIRTFTNCSCDKVMVAPPSTRPVVMHCVKVQLLSSPYPQHGLTALHWASFKGQTAVVNVLLNNGGGVDAVDKVGRCGVLLDGRVRDVHHVLYMLDTHMSVLMAPYSDIYHSPSKLPSIWPV